MEIPTRATTLNQRESSLSAGAGYLDLDPASAAAAYPASPGFSRLGSPCFRIADRLLSETLCYLADLAECWGCNAFDDARELLRLPGIDNGVAGRCLLSAGAGTLDGWG